MKDSLRFVHEMTEAGWKQIREGESFGHACSLCETLKTENPSSEFCVNTGSSLSQVSNDAPLLPSESPKSTGPRR